MELFIGLIFLSLIGIAVLLPVYFISKTEIHSKHSYLLIHIIINAAFIAWSIYDLYWTQHYAHGPSTLFIIIPAWPLLMLFYIFRYHIMVKKTYSKQLGIGMGVIYFLGITFEITKELVNK